MEKKMTFNYFYGTEADQFSFYRMLMQGLEIVAKRPIEELTDPPKTM